MKTTPDINEAQPTSGSMFVLLLVAFASPLVAAAMQSLCVFRSEDGHLYQAVIGGWYCYYGDNFATRLPEPYRVVFDTLFHVYVGLGSLFGVLTASMILPVLQRVVYRWLVWAGCTLLWFCCYYSMMHHYMIK